jgi:hypothetical protein
MKLCKLIILAGSFGFASFSFGDGFVNSITVSDSEIVGGAVDHQVGHVHIGDPAGLLGETVSLSTSSSALQVPPTVFIEPGSTQASFDYNAPDLTDHTSSATIFAAAPSQLEQATREIAINPMFIKNISTDGAPIVVGCSNQLRLTLNAPTAQDMDVHIAVSDSTVQLLSGSTVHFFAGDRTELILMTIDTGVKPKFTVTSAGQFALTTTMPTGLVRQSDIFRSVPLQIKSLDALKNSVKGGSSFSCRVTLNGTPIVDTPITVFGGSIFTFPTSVSVDGGTNSSTFLVNVALTKRTRTASITARYTDTMRSVAVTINP